MRQGSVFVWRNIGKPRLQNLQDVSMGHKHQLSILIDMVPFSETFHSSLQYRLYGFHSIRNDSFGVVLPHHFVVRIFREIPPTKVSFAETLIEMQWWNGRTNMIRIGLDNFRRFFGPSKVRSNQNNVVGCTNVTAAACARPVLERP